MPARARIKQPKPLRIGTALELVDVEGRRSAEEVRDLTVAAVRRNLPARSHRLEQSIGNGRVTRTANGYAVTVQPSKSVRYPGGRTRRTAGGGVSARDVARFVEGGTGVYGPKGKPIRPRRAAYFLIPRRVGGGAVARVESVRGQRARHPFARAQTSTEALAVRTLERGATRLAFRIERAL